MTRVLVLRPEPGASVTAERARRQGLDAVAVPLFVVEPVGWRAPDPGAFEGLLLTSANAVRHGGEQVQTLRTLKVYAIGEATAKAARDAGFEIALVGDSGGVERLVGSIDPDLRLLHLCGADRREPRRQAGPGMNGSGSRTGMGWGARLLVGLVLVLTGAGAAVWGLAHSRPAARFLGVEPAAREQPVVQSSRLPNIAAPPAPIEGAD